MPLLPRHIILVPILFTSSLPPHCLFSVRNAWLGKGQAHSSAYRFRCSGHHVDSIIVLSCRYTLRTSSVAQRDFLFRVISDCLFRNGLVFILEFQDTT